MAISRRQFFAATASSGAGTVIARLPLPPTPDSTGLTGWPRSVVLIELHGGVSWSRIIQERVLVGALKSSDYSNTEICAQEIFASLPLSQLGQFWTAGCLRIIVGSQASDPDASHEENAACWNMMLCQVLFTQFSKHRGPEPWTSIQLGTAASSFKFEPPNLRERRLTTHGIRTLRSQSSFSRIADEPNQGLAAAGTGEVIELVGRAIAAKGLGTVVVQMRIDVPDVHREPPETQDQVLLMVTQIVAGIGRNAMLRNCVVGVYADCGRALAMNRWGGTDHSDTNCIFLLGAGVRGGITTGEKDLRSRLADSVAQHLQIGH